ncbi:MAG: cytochrome c [Longimicrobiales bacterium]|nr:cytochrome c [Longimicrobiales bacterium]
MRNRQWVRGARRASRVLPVAVAVLLSGACTPMDDAMAAIFGRSMRDQPTFDPYESPLLPPEGAVSFSSGNFPAGPGTVNIGQPEGGDYLIPDFTQASTLNPADPVWSAFANPVEPTAASLERGKVVFDRYCAVCHGVDGVGANALILEKWQALVVYDLAGPVVQGYPDTYIYGMMRVGRGLMPQYGHQITHFDRWHVVNYVRQLQADFNSRGAGQAGEG